MAGALSTVESLPLLETPAGAPPPAPLMDAERAHRVAFLAVLAEALARAGVASHDLEEMIARCADALGAPVRASATPTQVLLNIGDGDDARARLIVVDGGGTSLTRLAALHAIARDVVAGRLRARDGLDRVREAMSARARRRPVWSALAGGAIAAAILVVLGAPTMDVAAGAVVGLVVATASGLCARGKNLGRLADVAAGALGAGASVAIDRFAGPIAVFPVTLAGLLPLLPGMSLTIAIGEIAARSLVSGASRLVGALAVLLSLGFGVAVGYRALDAGDLSFTVGQIQHPWWALALALLAAGVAMTVAFEARWRDLATILGAGLAATLAARWGGEALGTEFGALAGALAVGLGSNLYERLTRRPAQIALLPGILLLVPGSVGFRSVHSFVGHDALAGVEGVFTMFFVAIGIVTGLLLAGVLLPPAPLEA